MTREAYIEIHNTMSSRIDVLAENINKYLDALTEDYFEGCINNRLISKLANANKMKNDLSNALAEFENEVEEPAK